MALVAFVALWANGLGWTSFSFRDGLRYWIWNPEGLLLVACADILRSPSPTLFFSCMRRTPLCLCVRDSPTPNSCTSPSPSPVLPCVPPPPLPFSCSTPTFLLLSPTRALA